MKRIMYASGGFVTSDAIADALMDYASVLAVINSSDVVDCEGIDEEGTVRRIRMLLGPASQIMAMQMDGDAVEMHVDETVAELQHRTRLRLPDYTTLGADGMPST